MCFDAVRQWMTILLAGGEGRYTLPEGRSRERFKGLRVQGVKEKGASFAGVRVGGFFRSLLESCFPDMKKLLP